LQAVCGVFEALPDTATAAVRGFQLHLVEAGHQCREIVRLRAGDIDSAQLIIRIVQSKGRKTGTSCCRQSCWSLSDSGGMRGRHVSISARHDLAAEIYHLAN